MKAVICAAGKGSRLAPLTNVAPKCLLPVYNMPMIMYPLSVAKNAGINDVCIVISAEHAHLFANLLADGSDLGLNITFKIQKEALGVCDAICSAKDFVGDENFLLLLGDNIMFDDLKESVDKFTSGAQLFLSHVQDPRAFGVAKLDGEKIVGMIEKPINPPSNLIWTGCAIFDNSFFDLAKTISMSERGEFETPDVIQKYIDLNQATYSQLKYNWFDCGTHKSLVEASGFVHKISNSLQYERHQNTIIY